MSFLLPAFMIGIFGSMHCIGMCGPIALAIPFNSHQKHQTLLAVLIYNAGRIITYGIIGLIFGLFGEVVFIAGWQQKLSIALGIAILLFLFVPIAGSFGNSLKNKINKFFQPVYALLSSLLKKRNLIVLLLIGMINGLLPCGLIYAAIAGAIAVGSAWKGALFMVFFGLGTSPAMVTIPLIKTSIKSEVRLKLKKIYPAFMVVMALVFVLRGMNLGIPYLSPEIEKEKKIMGSCCSDRSCTNPNEKK